MSDVRHGDRLGAMGRKLAQVKVGPVRYNAPMTQVCIVGFVCFSSVGMFAACSGLGAGGTQDVSLSDTANAVLMACFAIMGFFAGSMTNILGPRLTMSIGTTGYALYIGSLWCFQTQHTRWFLILAGALLGVTAALLWSAQGCIMMAYPTEKEKGRAFSIFWSIFQMGTVTGSAIAISILAKTTLPTVSTGVYLAFMIIQLSAIATSWLILPPHLVIRSDGTMVELEKNITPSRELSELWKLFTKDHRVAVLFLPFFASNYFYSYQGAIVPFLFNGRTRALASLLAGAGSIFGSLFIGNLLDRLPGSRKTRSMCGLFVVLVLEIVVWSGGIAFQVQFKRGPTGFAYDWNDKKAVGPIILIFAYYVADAAYQGLAYYTMSCMTNDSFKLARLAGYYKGCQSAGSAIAFAMDAVRTPYMTELIVSWVMTLVALIPIGYVLFKAPESNYDIEGVVHVEELADKQLQGAALPSGHHTMSNDQYEVWEHGPDGDKDVKAS